METRGITLPEQGRTTIQLEPEAWGLVDAVAAARGQTWQAWVLSTAEGVPPGTSRAAYLRVQAMRQFRELTERHQLQAFAQERADAIAGRDPFANPDLDRILGFLDDQTLEENMRQCVVEGSTDLGGLVLHVGFDEFKRRCFWVENRMKGCPSVVISIPESA